MKLHWTDLAVLTVLVGLGCAAIYAGLTRAFRRAVAEKQRESDRQLNAMVTTVKALQSRVAELGRQQAEYAKEGDFAVVPPPDKPAVETNEPLKPELVATLTAAATAYLGQKARIRSAQQLAEESAGAWAQQGRVIVQTSHNLRSNG